MHAGLMRAACYAVPCDPSVAPDPLLAVHQELDSNNLVRLLSGVTASSRSVLCRWYRQGEGTGASIDRGNK